MQILVNNKPIVLKKGTSFDYIAENRLFTGSDSYTLSITIPIKDCPQNLEIFGFINRADVRKQKVVFDCDIIDRDFFRTGSLVITQVTEIEIKAQFLEGRSEQNFNVSFDDIYINELALGYPTKINTADVSVSDSWDWRMNCVAMPWVNNYSGNLQNAAKYKDISSGFRWESSGDLSFMPMLVPLIKNICVALNYFCDISELEESDFKYMVVCNTLPAAWNLHNFAYALPRWSITEFLEKLEDFLDGEFIVNHKSKTITFSFNKNIATLDPVVIEKVVDSYTTEVTQEDKSEYLGMKNIKYSDNDNRLWPYLSCQWYIEKYRDQAKVFATMSELEQWSNAFLEAGYEKVQMGFGYREIYSFGFSPRSEGNKLLYVSENDTYFIMFCYNREYLTTIEDTNLYKYLYRVMPVNIHGNRIIDKNSDNDVELSFVPAWIDDTDEEHGQVIFLDCGEMNSAKTVTTTIDQDGNTTTEIEEGGAVGGGGHFGGLRRSAVPIAEDYSEGEVPSDNEELPQSTAGRLMKAGNIEKNDAYFNVIYVGFWDSINRISPSLPHPYTDEVVMKGSNFHVNSPFSLRLDGSGTLSSWQRELPRIDGRQKYSFSFLASEIPNPRAVFIIHGVRYLCEKLTATFNERGRSELVKGNFFRLEE